MASGTERVERKLVAIFAADVAGYSRLMSVDEVGTLRALTAQRQIMDSLIVAHGGRIANTAGDSVLAEFPSVIDAVQGAVAVQEKLREASAGVPDDRALRFRIGVHVGDVMVQGGDLLGDGVNVASRVQALAEPGGVWISGRAYDEVEGKLTVSFDDKGEQHFKNIVRPVRVYAVAREPRVTALPTAEIKQDISFCRSPDGVRLAWAKAGQGPPLVRAANWMNHLEFDWDSPVRRHMLEGLARTHTLYRHDARGNGMSDWDVEEVSLEAFVSDLEAVVNAAGLTRFPLLGISQGSAIAIAYAAKHPDRITRLILLGGYALGGRKRAPQEQAKRDALATLMRTGWDSEDSTFRDVFTSLLVPDALPEERKLFGEHQKRTTTGECAARFLEVVGDFDVRDLLPRVAAPTLVMHTRGDLMCPLEAGRQMAAGIPGARFVVLPGRNHLLVPGEPAAARFFEEVQLFLAVSTH